MDGRNQSYITYEIEVIIYMMILKNWNFKLRIKGI
jgi:hypothetical protein